LQPSNATQLSTLLSNLYDPASPQYHHWLPKGQFDTLFAPSASERAQVTSYLQSQGLQIVASSSPFLIRAAGTTAQMETAFGTQVTDYVASNAAPYYANATSIKVPLDLSGIVTGVVGLTNTVREHPNYITALAAAQHRGVPVPRYGAGPGGSGLTPSQTESLYNAKGVYAKGVQGEGAGKILAVFELSGYTRSDITTWEHKFFGPSENVPLVDVSVDGGPIHPACPKGDSCGPFGPPPCTNGCNGPDYSGDIEVNADLEQQIAIAPRIQGILVYNAPNDITGQTVIDEYMQMAQDDLADSISTSWGLCEQDAGFSQAVGESIAFEEMAVQGQSIFDASGDTGAYDCLGGSGNPALAAEDPSTQPYVTSVGGTSFESFDPGTNANPAYPTGAETVWNVLDLCNGTSQGQFWCGYFGAGGGGNSIFWGRPAYQTGPGVTSAYTRYAPYCKVAAKGQACREVPDVSANADEYTGYSEYCTGNPKTNSTCATFSASQTPPGWFQIGGTSLSAPLWAGVVALWDSYHNDRAGNANIGLYRILRSPQLYSQEFHDITGLNQTENNNGHFPVTPNYDESTGIGTPNISAIAEGNL
jgi:kumamolisin